MGKLTIRGHKASRGRAEGEALVARKPFEFRHVDHQTGVVTVPGHELEGQSVKDKIMVYPHGCGPTTEEWSLYVMRKSGVAPKGVINMATYVCSTIGAILADIPMVYGFDENILAIIKNGDHIIIDGDKGIVQIEKKK